MSSTPTVLMFAGFSSVVYCSLTGPTITSLPFQFFRTFSFGPYFVFLDSCSYFELNLCSLYFALCALEMQILEEDLHDHHCVAGSHAVILSGTAAFGVFKFISFT